MFDMLIQATHEECFAFVWKIAGGMGSFIILLCGGMVVLFKMLIREKNKRMMDHMEGLELLKTTKRRR